MRVVTAERMRELDRMAIQECGIPGSVLMENAAAAVVSAVKSACGELNGKRIAIFCGVGNNGGDGYAAARRLMLRGVQSVVYVLAAADELKGDALVHFSAMKASGVVVKDFAKGMSDEEFKSFDAAVDAVLGTGLRDAPRELYSEAICLMNRLRRSNEIPIVSVDIPSGVNADTGSIPGDAVDANITVTFAYPKLGMFLFPGAAKIGELRIDDIGFDWSRVSTNEDPGCGLNLPDAFRDLFRPRPINTNKGDVGHVGIIAGSRGMAGAPALVARSAQRAGAGLVTVFTPESVQPVVASKLDEQMTAPLPEVNGSASITALDMIADFATRASVLCIGPGLTTHPETVQLVHRLLEEMNVPIVLDADGLNALATKPELIDIRRSNSDAPLIITPHPGEAARLLGTSIPEIESNRIECVRELSSRYGAIAILKGRYTLISDLTGNVWINTSGNPGMASGGMGDTLTGIIGGLLAQWRLRSEARGSLAHPTYVDAQLAASAGVYLHGCAGDMAALAHGEAGTTAGDVIDNLPAAMQALYRCASSTASG